MGNERKGQVEKAIELYKNKKQNKMKVKDISIETGIAESTLYRIFRENGLRTQRREKKIDVNKLEEALYMFLNREELKLTVKDIVEKTGISKQTIYVEVKAQNLDYKLRNEGYPKEDLEKAVILYQRPIREGFTLSKIYHETGIPKSALYEELNKRGIEVRKGNRKSYTKKSMETTIFMYQNRKKLGMTVKEIVKETGVCINALNEELNKRGLVEGNRVYPVKLVNQAIELIISRRNAYSVPQVSNKTGIHESTLYAELRNRGIKLRERKSELSGISRAN